MKAKQEHSAKGQHIDPKMIGLESILTHHAYDLVLSQCDISNQYNTSVINSTSTSGNTQCSAYIINKIDGSLSTGTPSQSKASRLIKFDFDNYGSISSWTCTCGLHTSMGIPCRHYFAAITTQPELSVKFNTSSWTRKHIHPFWSKTYCRDAIQMSYQNTQKEFQYLVQNFTVRRSQSIVVGEGLTSVDSENIEELLKRTYNINLMTS
jgi:hypothetical protein